MNRTDQRLTMHKEAGFDVCERCVVKERDDQLSGRLLLAQEQERRRIANELHDNLSQRVAFLAIDISRLSRTWSQVPMVAADIQKLTLQTSAIATEIHDLSHRLHSSKLEALGLVAAVRGLCREFIARGVAVDFVDRNVPASLSHDVTLCLFRIVQEGLNNILKHSGAHEARVTLTGDAGSLTLSIVDGGRGFDPARVAVSPERLGLASMRERLRSIGGQVVICSKPGRGTTIEARVSLASDRSAASRTPQRRIRETNIAAGDAAVIPRRIRLWAIAVVAVMLVAGVPSLTATLAAQSPTSAERGTDEGWKTIIYPIHAWLPVFGADVTLPGQPAPPGSGGGDSGGITIPSAKTSGNFNGAALAGFRVERARVSIEGEFLWAGMSGSVEAPHFNLTVDTISFRILGGFEVAPALYIDGGVRRLALDMNASILDFQPVGWKPGIWEPVVGVTYRPMLRKNVRLFTQADVGFSTDDSNRSGAATASVEWKPISHMSLGAGWGWTYVRVNGTILTKDVHLSQTLNGPMFTLGIPF